MISDKEKKNIEQFYEAVVAIDNVDECREFLDDIATIRELIDLSSRLQVAKMLDEGKVFNEIIHETGASSATISRVNKCLSYGTGGYKKILDKIKK